MRFQATKFSFVEEAAEKGEVKNISRHGEKRVSREVEVLHTEL
jgi:hypothetical protein